MKVPKWVASVIFTGEWPVGVIGLGRSQQSFMFSMVRRLRGPNADSKRGSPEKIDCELCSQRHRLDLVLDSPGVGS